MAHKSWENLIFFAWFPNPVFDLVSAFWTSQHHFSAKKVQGKRNGTTVHLRAVWCRIKKIILKIFYTAYYSTVWERWILRNNFALKVQPQEQEDVHCFLHFTTETYHSSVSAIRNQRPVGKFNIWLGHQFSYMFVESGMVHSLRLVYRKYGQRNFL